jgi:hypothetical protein
VSSTDKQSQQQPAEPEDYSAPALTDLGSFEEITKANPGTGSDFEGSSVGTAN